MAIGEKRMTSETFLAFAGQPQNAGRLLELVNGEIVEKVVSFVPSQIAGNIVFALKLYLRGTRLGRVTTADDAYVISKTDVFIPDVAYISRERLPERPPHESPSPPDLAVEVRSHTDRKRDLRQKAERYLAGGTRLVWLVFPEEQVVEVHTPDADVLVESLSGTLSGDEVLPGFSLKVADIFADE